MIENLRRRIDSDKADLFLEDAIAMVEAYTGQRVTEQSPHGLQTAAIRLAVILYNREGIEGESARQEGGIQRQMESLPMEIKLLCDPYRVARVIV